MVLLEWMVKWVWMVLLEQTEQLEEQMEQQREQMEERMEQPREQAEQQRGQIEELLRREVEECGEDEGDRRVRQKRED